MIDLGIPGVGEATLIASGGSALVYRASTDTGERVAVKVLRGIRGSEVTRRFERELSAAERLSGHPNIMQIRTTGLTGAGEPYLVMPLVDGGSLQDELEANGAFSLQAATRDVAAACDALAFAHDQGVLHRDIKPANLLRAPDGSIIVTDFGIARVVDAGITSATIGASTPLYAAPELLADNKASVHSEIYGLGALLYALLAGRPAFADSENIWATMHRVRTEPPPPIAGVPAPVMRVIHQAMSKEPHDRPASAHQFRENLRFALTAPDHWVPPPPTAELPADDNVRIGPAPQRDVEAEDDPEDDPEDFEDVVLGPSRRDGEPGSALDRIVLGSAGQTADLDDILVGSGVPPQGGDADASTVSYSGPGLFRDMRRADAPAPPPVPAYGRPAPAVGRGPRRDSSTLKILGAALVLAGVAALSWWATSQLLAADDVGDGSAAPPVDNSLPSPSDTDDPDGDDQNGSGGSGDSDGEGGDSGSADQDGMSIDDLPDSPQIPNTFVSFTGDHFSALLPEGWQLAERDRQETYGFRSRFVNGDMYLNIDTTPKEQREPGGDIAQSARDIAANIASASEVRTEVIDGLTMHSFTFRNDRGVASIDIFFEVDGDGYAVVAGSASDPDTAFATARLVALSVRSNPT